MASLSARLLLTLQDGVSGPAKKVGRSVQDMTKAVREAEVQLLRQQQRRAAISRGMAQASSAAMTAVSGALAPAALAFGAQQSYTRFAAAERQIGRIGVTAGATAEEITAVNARVSQLAKSYATSQDSVVAGLDALVAAGRSLPDALAFLPSVTATAQAAGADITDIATTADAVGRSFSIASGDMQKAFDILVRGGQLGKFELKDMAQYLPSLAPAFEALGYKGEEGLKKLVAALQVVRERSGSAGEAATAFQNVIGKLETDETARRFADFGVDLRARMADARRDGEDLLNVFIRLSQQALGGDLSKLPQLFADQEMQEGMRALINGVPQLTGYVKELGSAAGSTQKALDTILVDNQAKIDRMASSWDGLVKSLGATVAPVISPVMEGISDLLDREGAISEGMRISRGGVLEESDIREEFGRRYYQNNPDGNRISMIAALKDALEKVGRGIFKTAYDGEDATRRVREGLGKGPTREQAFAISGLDAAPSARPTAQNDRTGTPLSDAEQRLLYNRGRVAAEMDIMRSIAKQPRYAQQGAPSEAYVDRKQRKLATSKAMDAAEDLGQAQAYAGTTNGISKSYWTGQVEEARAELQKLTAGMPEAAQQGFQAYAVAVAAGGGQVTEQARLIGEDIKASLSVTATPTIDTSSIRGAQAEVDQLRRSLEALPGAAQAAAESVRRANADYSASQSDIED